MQKAVLFGAGKIGEKAIMKLAGAYEIIAFCDNNEARWGEYYCGLEILPPGSLKMLNAVVIICSDYYSEIYEQLVEMGVREIIGIEPYSYQLMRISQGKFLSPVQKEKKVSKILFVQNTPCIRTYKIAYLMSKKGIIVDVAYSLMIPKELDAMFEGVFREKYPINSYSEFVDFLNKSDYDIIHCSNEPDVLTVLSLCSNKKIVHDSHDPISLVYRPTNEQMVLEYVANCKSAGRIYTSEEDKLYVESRYEIKTKNSFVLDNWLIEGLHVKESCSKLSESDGKVHCVYEGGLDSEETSYRNLEDIFLKIAEEGIHVHFYTRETEYCKSLEQKHLRIHYEGFRSPKELAFELKRYDCGLVVINEFNAPKTVYETTCPNKMYDYLNAGIPIVTNAWPCFERFLEKHPVGVVTDIGNISTSIRKAANIQIEEDYLSKHNLTMDSRADALLDFYTSLL